MWGRVIRTVAVADAVTRKSRRLRFGWLFIMLLNYTLHKR